VRKNGFMLERIVAVAELDDRPGAADDTRARAAEGDHEQSWILEQWEAGRLLLARIDVVATGRDEDARPVEGRHVLDGVWLERDVPPAVEEQIADVAPSALHAIASDLRGRGVKVGGEDLERCYLHVELGARLRRALEAA
jgi:hypothetical protein